MPLDDPTRTPPHRAGVGYPPPRRRLRRVAAAAAVLGLVAGAWLAIRGLAARRHLNDARQQLLAVEQTLRDGGLRDQRAGVAARLTAAAADTRAARRLTSDPLWRAAGGVPVLGCPLRTSATVASTADGLSRDVLRPLAASAPAMLPRRTGGGVAVDPTALRRAAAPVAAVRQHLAHLQAALDRSSACGLLGRTSGVAAARSELRSAVARSQRSVDALSAATALLPGMLGGDGPRRYLLVVQNTAESRATGGILGAVGVLTAAEGRVSLGAVQSNSTLPPLPPGLRLPLAADVAQRYARNGITRYWQDANLTPDYPTAARIYRDMWQSTGGASVDGVVALDPATLSYLLDVTGPVRLPDGSRVAGPQLVGRLESGIYATLPSNAARDAYFAAAGAAIYRHVLAAPSEPARLVPALARAAGEGRLLVWSATTGEQRRLAGTALGGALPGSPGPYLGVVTQNAASGKLDYYLRRHTDYRGRRLPDGTGQATVTVRLSNTAPTRGLTPYVLAHDAAGRPILHHQGRNVLYVSVFAGVGSTFDGATIDGRPAMLESESERGHSVFSTHVTIDAGQTRTLRLTLLEPRWGPVLTVRRQPLVAPERLVVHGIRPTGG